MANNWAIVIGINQYRFLQPLKYAKRDAEAMHNFLMQEAKFDRIFLFTDDSPPLGGKFTDPLRANLLRVLRQIFEKPFMKDGDNFWFFFSGHGIPHNGQDYLMPQDGDPENIENTGISTNTITNYLRGCGADNAVMILDACRSGGKKSGEGIGRQTEVEARQSGVISLFSCSPNQYSYELEAIKQGAFTHALLEGLGIRGQRATVERLDQYLEHRVPELVSQHLGKVQQTPYTIAEPLNRSHLILMPKYAKPTDIDKLKNDAYRAQVNRDWDLAKRLWIRVNAAASGLDIDAVKAIERIVQEQWKESHPVPPIPPKPSVPQPPPPIPPKPPIRRGASLGQVPLPLINPSSSQNLTGRQFPKWCTSAVNTGVFQITSLAVWLLIGYILQENIDSAEFLAVLILLGALGGVLTGLLGGMCWKKINPSIRREEVFLKCPLIGLIIGASVWGIIGSILETRLIRGSEILIGFIGGVVSILILSYWLHKVKRR
jgi:uncharacterized caspase-like protein